MFRQLDKHVSAWIAGTEQVDEFYEWLFNSKGLDLKGKKNGKGAGYGRKAGEAWFQKALGNQGDKELLDFLSLWY